MDAPKKPDSLKRIKGTDTYEDIVTKRKFESTRTDDGHRLLVITGSALDKWGIRKHFRDGEDRPIAVAVLDSDDKLIGVALGHGDAGTTNPIPLFGNGRVTIEAIIDSHNLKTEFKKRNGVQILIEDMEKVNKNHAESLNKLVSIGYKKTEPEKAFPEDMLTPKDKTDPRKMFKEVGATVASVKDHERPSKTPIVAVKGLDQKSYLS